MNNNVQWKTRLYTDGEKGQVLELEHNGEKMYKIIIGHIQEYSVGHDKRVNSGDLIAISGGSPWAVDYEPGTSDGSHVHAEFYIDGENVEAFDSEKDFDWCEEYRPEATVRPYKIGATVEQQEYVDYAWDISQSKEFVEMLEAENGLWTPDRQSEHYHNGIREPSFGFCQIHMKYHPEVYSDYGVFVNDDPYWQLDLCWQYFSSGVAFYGANIDTSDHFEWR